MKQKQKRRLKFEFVAVAFPVWIRYAGPARALNPRPYLKEEPSEYGGAVHLRIIRVVIRSSV